MKKWISNLFSVFAGNTERNTFRQISADEAAVMMEREQGYMYPHNYPNHWVKQQYLPDELANTRYYEYGPNKVEQAAKQYWDAIKGK